MTDHSIFQQGGCLCRKVRFEVYAEPYYVAVCSCRFCQRLTGSDYNVESMFRPQQFQMTGESTTSYAHTSEGSGQSVHIHFCKDCGTSVFLRPDRFPDCVGVFSGSFDNPNWFRRDPDITGYFFVSEAPRGMMVPAGFDVYRGHARALDGSMNQAERYRETFMVGRNKQI